MKQMTRKTKLKIDTLPDGYGRFLEGIKFRIRTVQVKAALSANRELVLLYWEIGREILERQNREGWGSKIVTRLSRDLSREFPDMKGFSPRNLLFMRSFAETYKDIAIVKQLVSLIPWGHIVRLIQTVNSDRERTWYIRKAIEHGWSRNVLMIQIEQRLFHRKGKAITNFNRTLPSPQSDLANNILKDPYIFDFLSIGKDVHEREIEKALVSHVTQFLLELGAGFAFVGRQFRMEVSNKDFFIDLLFYHTKLHCYVAVELKAGEFKPEFAGQINFYLSALDSQVKATEDKPSIGLILCAKKDKVVAEYALRNVGKPIGVAQWQTKIVEMLPKQLKDSLPTVEQIEAEFSKKNAKSR
ncbi:MAG: YhcG family protein [Elusimicrobiota bacterium]